MPSTGGSYVAAVRVIAISCVAAICPILSWVSVLDFLAAGSCVAATSESNATKL